MILRPVLLLSALVAAGAGSVAHAQAAGDARCLIAANIFASNEKDATKKQAANAAMYYYLGKLTGRISDAQLKTVMATEGKALDVKTLPTTMDACVKALAARQGAIQAIGQDLAKQTAAGAAPAKK